MPRLNDKLVCYYCGEPSTSMEHVPPRYLFKYFESDSITVPSCSEHNTTKSGDDQTIINALRLTLIKRRTDEGERNSITDKLWKNHKSVIKSMVRSKHQISLSPLFSGMSKELEKMAEVPYFEKTSNVYDWANKLTAGIIYNGLGYYEQSIDWTKSAIWTPDILKTNSRLSYNEGMAKIFYNDEFKKHLDELNWQIGWSALSLFICSSA